MNILDTQKRKIKNKRVKKDMPLGPVIFNLQPMQLQVIPVIIIII